MAKVSGAVLVLGRDLRARGCELAFVASDLALESGGQSRTLATDALGPLDPFVELALGRCHLGCEPTGAIPARVRPSPRVAHQQQASASRAAVVNEATVIAT